MNSGEVQPVLKRPLLLPCNWARLCYCLVAKSCLTLWDPLDGSPPGSSVHRVAQVSILEWVPISSSRASSPPRDWTHRRILYCRASREACSRLYTFFNKNALIPERDVKANRSAVQTGSISTACGKSQKVRLRQPEHPPTPNQMTDIDWTWTSITYIYWWACSTMK